MELLPLAALGINAIAIVLIVGIGILALTRPPSPGRNTFVVMSMMGALWIIFYVFELISPDLTQKMFWDNVQWIMSAGIPALFIHFADQFTRQSPARAQMRLLLLLVIPLIFLVLAFTYPLHELTHRNIRIEPGYPFDSLIYQFGPASWLIFGYGYMNMSIALLVLGRYLAAISPQARPQIMFIFGGIITILLITAITFLGDIRLFGQRDWAPITFTIGYAIMAVGFLRYGFLEAVPIARNRIFETMREGIIVVDLQGKIIDINRAAVWEGMTAQAMIGRSLAEVFAAWPQYVTEFAGLYEGERLIHVTLNGEQRHFQVQVSPLIERSGLLSGRVLMIYDLTQQISAQAEIAALNAALQAQTTMLTTLLDHIPAYIALFDAAGNLQFANRHLTQDLQQIAQDVTERAQLTSSPYMSVWNENMSRLRQVFSTGKTDTWEAMIPPNRHSSARAFTMTAVPIQDARGGVQSVIGVAIDVTLLKDAEAQRYELALERQRLDILTTFIQDTAHEFRTPLSSIVTNAYLLVRSPDAAAQERRLEQIDTIVQELTRLLGIMQDVVRIFNDPTLRLETVQPAQLLRDLHTEMLPEAQAKQHTLLLQVEADLPPLLGDPLLLSDALRQVVQNAIKFTPAGGRITLAAHADLAQIVIGITDTGIGMTPAVRQRAFDMFYRADTSRNQRGFGLGLPLAQRIIELHEGQAKIDSQPGQGTTFTLHLPLVHKSRFVPLRLNDRAADLAAGS